MVKVQADPLTLVPGLHDPGLAFLTGTHLVFCLQLLVQHVRQIEKVVCITLRIGLLRFTERPAQDMYLSVLYGKQYTHGTMHLHQEEYRFVTIMSLMLDNAIAS